MVMLTDLFTIWPDDEPFMPTRELVDKLIAHHPDYWGSGSPFGKPLNETRLGRMITQAAKVTSSRPHTQGPRGYLRKTLESAWHQLGIGRMNPDNPADPANPDTEWPQISGLSEKSGLSGLEETPTPPGGATRQPFCPGCGYYYASHDRHSDDCTASKQRDDR
jgi:hypothetical protein